MDNALNEMRDRAYQAGLDDGMLKAWEAAYAARNDGADAIINILHALVGKYEPKKATDGKVHPR